MSHTPGPWKNDGVDMFDEVEGPVWVIEDEAGTNLIVAKIPGRGDDEEAKGNATIIARAPQLLASLKALVADIQEEMWSVSKCWCHQITTSERPCDVCNLAAAKVIIAEIEGGA